MVTADLAEILIGLESIHSTCHHKVVDYTQKLAAEVTACIDAESSVKPREC